MKSFRLASAKWLALPPGLRRTPGRRASSHARPVCFGPFLNRQGAVLVPLPLPRITGTSHDHPRHQILVDLSHHHVREDLAGLDRLQSDVAAHRRRNTAMAENLSNKLKLAWPIFEDYRAGSMPELVDSHF